MASQAVGSPSASTVAPVHTATPPPLSSARQSFSGPLVQPIVTHRMPFYPNLPWYSMPGEEFPPKARKARRRRRGTVPVSAEPLKLPSRGQAEEQEALQGPATTDQEQPDGQRSPSWISSHTITPATSKAPSETDSTLPTTPSSAPARRANPHAQGRAAMRPAVPLVPIAPAVPKSKAAPGSRPSVEDKDK
ncbi:hypothetical protein BDY21DRAFT_328249, partial [Lineolata rhizophorae]